MPSPDRVTQSPKEVDAAGHRLAELSDMHTKGELPVVPGTQEYLAGIGRTFGDCKHSHTVNGEAGLPGRFCTVHALESRLALGCVEGQSHLKIQSDHFIYFWL